MEILSENELTSERVNEECKTEEGVIKVIKSFLAKGSLPYVYIGKDVPIADQMVLDGKLTSQIKNGVVCYSIIHGVEK